MNKTDSAVRITHIPTGSSSSARTSARSSNRQTAMRILKSRLAEHELERREAELARERGEVLDTGFGSQIRSYVLHPYQLVKDHRTDVEEGNAQAVLDGDLDPSSAPISSPTPPEPSPSGPSPMPDPSATLVSWQRADSAPSGRAPPPEPVQEADLTEHVEDPARVTTAELNGDPAEPRSRSRRSRAKAEPPGTPMIVFEAVTKVYDPNVVALRETSFVIDKGEFVFLVGPSGSGKSTIMRLSSRSSTRPMAGSSSAAASSHAWAARCRCSGATSAVSSRTSSSSPTAPRTTTSPTRSRSGDSKAQIRAKVPEILALVGLGSKMNSFPHELSGGEQQRVSVARAFVNHPPLLICDEPTGNLDPDTSVGIMQLLYRINRTGTTVVMATHDREMVDKMRKRVIALEEGVVVRDERRGGYG